jgi:hypothetical protein
LSSPHALIAVAAGDRYVYALGYFGHILYQYNTVSGVTDRVTVGSIAGHISRNFIADDRGHAFVPRLEYNTNPGPASSRSARPWHVSLVEYDTQLREIAATAIYRYGKGNPTLNHGIVAFQPLPNRSIAFITHDGFLYIIDPPHPTAQTQPASQSPAIVRPIDYFYPHGPSYTACLSLSSDGTRLQGLSRLQADLYPHQAYRWITFDPATGSRTVQPVTLTNADPGILEDALLYGSAVRDAAGRVYVAGTILHQGKPLLLQIQP